MNLTIGLLCSGELGLKCIKQLSQSFQPQFIFTDKKSNEIIEYAQSHSIPIYIGNPRNDDTSVFLDRFQTDIIFSINYIFIVKNNILVHPKLYAINLHGSLLPKYRGRTPHVWAIINGEKETGISAHLMAEGCDTGDIIMQKRIPILQEYTGGDILNIFKDMYSEMILEILSQIKTDHLLRIPQDNHKATYFKKRIPEDGLINWSWQKDQIFNWVRAQAFPYPGAFSFYKGKKIIIDKISFSEEGFDDSMQNGLIVKTQPKVLVKTPNGIIELSDIRNEHEVKLEVNNKFE